MFRKIHSNRDPQATLFQEIRKEFKPYFDKVQSGCKRLAQHYPRFLFVMMVVNITLSVILVTTVFKRKEALPKRKPANTASPLSTGFDRIQAAGMELGETIRLKGRIDSLAHLKALSHNDSLALMTDLDSLRHIRLTINH